MVRTGPRLHSVVILIGSLALTMGLVCLAGCNYVAGAMLVIEGPPKIPKVTDMPKGRSLVVFIDDPKNRVPRRSLRELAARAAEEDIIRKKLTGAGEVYGSIAAFRVAATERYGQPMAIADIGRAVGAELVLYVRVEDWTLAREVGTVSPAVQARVKIIDALANKRVWPGDDAGGFIMQANLPIKMDLPPSSMDERQALENRVAQRFGLEISRLFYEHERETVADKNERL